MDSIDEKGTEICFNNNNLYDDHKYKYTYFKNIYFKTTRTNFFSALPTSMRHCCILGEEALINIKFMDIILINHALELLLFSRFSFDVYYTRNRWTNHIWNCWTIFQNIFQIFKNKNVFS